MEHLQYIDIQHLFCCKNTPSFTGKEKDSETGFYYFGARYYDPSLSGLFLSVDPMADKYPSTSPYAYCAWSPIRIIDPNGMDTIVSINIENGEINMSVSEKYARGCLVQYLNNGTEEPIKEYICTGYIYSYKRGRTSIIDFEENADAENVYNQLSGRIDGNLTSSVEWNYYDNMFDIPSQIITSQKRDEIDVSDFMELGGLTNSVRHYQPYYSDLEYSLPSPEDIIYSRKH